MVCYSGTTWSSYCTYPKVDLGVLDEKALGKTGRPSHMGQYFYNGPQAPTCCYPKCIPLGFIFFCLLRRFSQNPVFTPYYYLTLCCVPGQYSKVCVLVTDDDMFSCELCN